ncbi:hypothetical protein [Kordiimonas pumila]|uniref:Uncharacterized protein n=1 Tax=Kordiimonas pumila TaxID=2161677 RepID=A0ABV7CZZ1_9PROT|nr:hypothetical protein [Kordiimonas pumila]
MDISSIQGFGGGRPSSAPLSDNQKTLIAETLSAYNTENLTEEDAQTIVNAFKEAGIKPGKELATELEQYGIDARELGKQAGIEPPADKPAPPPEGGIEKLDKEGLQKLQSIIENYDLTNLSDEEEQELSAALQEAGLIGEDGSLFSVKV